MMLHKFLDLAIAVDRLFIYDLADGSFEGPTYDAVSTLFYSHLSTPLSVEDFSTIGEVVEGHFEVTGGRPFPPLILADLFRQLYEISLDHRASSRVN